MSDEPNTEQIQAEIQEILEANSLTGSEDEIQAFNKERAGEGWNNVKFDYQTLAEGLKPTPPDFELRVEEAPEPFDPIADAQERAKAALDLEVSQIRMRGDTDLPAAWDERVAELKAEIDEKTKPVSAGGHGNRMRNAERMNMLADAELAFEKQFGVHPQSIRYAIEHPLDPQVTGSVANVKVVVPIVSE